MFRPLAALSFFACLSAAPLAAQSTTILSPCWDGANGGASQTAEEMGKFLEGTWRMSANGTGFTLGTNVMAVNLRWDEASQTLRMEGGGGPSVALTPVAITDSGDNAPFDMAVEQLTPSKLTEQELEVLDVCAKPARYFWQVSMGNNKSWGGLAFFEKGLASGFMANSAGGSRNVVMTR